jgi:hypothetical protein
MTDNEALNICRPVNNCWLVSSHSSSISHQRIFLPKTIRRHVDILWMLGGETRNRLTSKRMKANNRDTCPPFF